MLVSRRIVGESLAIEAAMVVCRGDEVLPEHLPASLGNGGVGTTGMTSSDGADGDRLPTLQEMERAHIERALRTTGGHRGNAARMLGISERNLYRKLREYGLLQ